MTTTATEHDAMRPGTRPFRRAGVALALGILWIFAPGGTRAQEAVQVTARLDTNTLGIGASTTLRVFAQVSPAVRENADRIFSWYIDVLNTNGTVATARYDLMTKPTSDNEALLGSTGTADGSNRRGVYDTFLNRPGAGVSNAIELLSIPIRATSPGTTRFLVRAGTGDPFLSEDFIVAPRDGETPWTGGNYAAAFADLTVSTACAVSMTIQPLTGNGGPGGRLQLSFAPCPGKTHTVEARTLVNSGTWGALPGAPHNSGSVIVTNSQVQRMFRVRVE